jgi:hypothetical protein
LVHFEIFKNMSAIPHMKFGGRGPALSRPGTRTVGSKDVSTSLPNFRPQKSINKKNQIVGRRKKLIQLEDESNMRRGGIVMQTRLGGIHDLPKQQLQRRQRVAAKGSSRLVPTQILDPVNAESVSGERVMDPTAPSMQDMSYIRSKNRSEIQRIAARLRMLQRMPPSNERNAEMINLRNQAKAFTRNLDLNDPEEGIPPIPPVPLWHPNDVRKASEMEPAVPQPVPAAPQPVPAAPQPADESQPPIGDLFPDQESDEEREPPQPMAMPVGENKGQLQLYRPPPSEPKGKEKEEDRKRKRDDDLYLPSKRERKDDDDDGPDPYLKQLAIEREEREKAEEEEKPMGDRESTLKRKREGGMDALFDDKPNHKREMMWYGPQPAHAIEAEHAARQRAIDEAAHRERHALALKIESEASSKEERKKKEDERMRRHRVAEKRQTKGQKDLMMTEYAAVKDVEMAEKKKATDSQFEKEFKEIRKEHKSLKPMVDLHGRMGLAADEAISLLSLVKRDPEKKGDKEFQKRVAAAMDKMESAAAIKEGLGKTTKKGRKFADRVYKMLRSIKK